MDLIYQNPFRVLGLPVTSSDKDIAKRIGDISLYAQMGKPMEYDVDHYFPTRPIRTEESVEEAKQAIEQPYNKLFHALFWFWEEAKNTVDKMAFNELKSGNIDKALQFWGKEIEKGANSRNKSNRKNLAILLLGLSQEGGVLNKEYFLNSLSISGEFIARGDFEQFSNEVLGEKHNVEVMDVVNQYVDEEVSTAKQYLGKRKSKHKVTVKEVLDEFSSYPDDIRVEIQDKFINKNVHNIEKEIEIAQERRQEDVTKSNKAGFNLYDNTKEDLKKLEVVLSKSDLKYQLIADKLAEEILQCGIDYLNEHYESEIDPGKETVELAYHAKEIAIGSKASERIIENIDFFENYINEKPKREKLETVKNEVSFIKNKLSGFQSRMNTIDNAKDLINSCMEKLTVIKNNVGYNNEYYLELSSAVGNSAYGMVVSIVNIEMEKYNKFMEYMNKKFMSKQYGIGGYSSMWGPEPEHYGPLQLKEIIIQAWEVTKITNKLDMSEDFRANFEKNRTTIKSICKNLDISTSEGCYIATMVYGSYEAPEVKILRKVRDEIIVPTIVGRLFLKLYYNYSPWIVDKTKNGSFCQSFFRKIFKPLINFYKVKGIK